MTSENVTELSSLDTKMDKVLSKEEECDYYRQRFNSLKIVLEEVQKQMTVYKNRCLGVDTIVLALKESKQENVKLSKHVKALETAISILQKRLAQNGLSNSVNIQGTELFVPGASKQTLDNLAKETARLRSLLKQENGHFGMKPADELENMKAELEETKSEKNNLKQKLKAMEGIKLKLTSDYEETIQKLKKEMKDDRTKFEEELKAYSVRQQTGIQYESEKSSVGLQVNVETSNTIMQLKDLLRQTVDKCSELDGQLPLHSANMAVISKEGYDKLETKHKEAMLMNQRWQMFSKEREKQIQALNDRLRELSDPHQMTALIEDATQQKTLQMTHELNLKDAEILELRKQINHMSKELTEAKKLQQVHEENSTVEILKQQIQVCTEDFNTERKDRELAVQKARALQDENDKLKMENERLKAEKLNLKKQNDGLKKIAEQQQRQQPKPQLYESALSSGYSSEIPSPQYSNPGQRYSYHMIPVQETPTQCVEQPLGPGPQGIPFSDYQGASASYVQDNVYRTSPLSDMRNYGSSSSMSRNIASPGSSSPPPNNMSMPPVMKRGGGAKEELSCPNCNKKFSEDDLMLHIEECSQELNG